MMASADGTLRRDLIDKRGMVTDREGEAGMYLRGAELMKKRRGRRGYGVPYRQRGLLV